MAYVSYELYHEPGSGWRWRLMTVNGRAIAYAAEAYVNKHDCLDAIDLVKSSGPAAVREVASPGTPPTAPAAPTAPARMDGKAQSH